jgi:hypothetical protein
VGGGTTLAPGRALLEIVMRLATLTALAVLALAAPASAQTLVVVDVAARAPAAADIETGPDWDVVGIGAAMLAGSWALNVAGSALWSIAPTQHDSDYFAWSLVPVAGPFVQMANLAGNDWQIPILAVAGATQTIGLLVALVGSATQGAPRTQSVNLRATPYASADGAGLALAASF